MVAAAAASASVFPLAPLAPTRAAAGPCVAEKKQVPRQASTGACLLPAVRSTDCHQGCLWTFCPAPPQHCRGGSQGLQPEMHLLSWPKTQATSIPAVTVFQKEVAVLEEINNTHLCPQGNNKHLSFLIEKDGSKTAPS